MAALEARPALPHPQHRLITRTQLLSTATDDLAINELITLLPDDKVSEDTNSMLLRNMKWAMGQDPQQTEWLSRFFSEMPPSIDPEQKNLVNQSLDWYQHKFAMAYLTKSFNTYSGPNQPTHRLSEADATTLDNFLKTGLAKDKDFNVQHQGIYISAYIGTQARLRQYINDSVAEVVGWAQGTVVFSRNDVSKALTVPVGVTVKTASGKVFTTQAIVNLSVGQAKSDAVAIAALDVGPDGVVEANTITQFGDQPAKGIDAVTNSGATTLAPDSGGVKWAKKLFALLTTGSQFIQMVNRISGAAGDPKALGPVNNFSCLLTTLDPSGTIARNYFQSVLSGVVIKLVPQVVHQDKDTILQWLPTAMAELFRRLANGELPNISDISTTEAKEMYQEFLKYQTDICLAVAELLQNVKGISLINQVQEAEKQFDAKIATRWTRLAKASRFVLVLGWIGGVTSIIISLTRGDWKKMTDIERAEFVGNCLQLTLAGFNAVPIMWQGTKAVTLPAWNKFSAWWNKPERQTAIEQVETNAVNGEEVTTTVAKNVSEIYEGAKATGTTLGKGTMFERIFAEGAFSGVLKIIGAVAAAAMAAFSLWQLIEDVKRNASVTTEVFDSLIFVANFLSLVCIVVDLFVATACIPILGAVLAIIGIILALIATFEDKPDSPIDDWRVHNGITFVQALPPQTPA